MISNIQIAPSTQVYFNRSIRFIPSYTSTPVDVTFEVLHGTVVSDDGEIADVLVDDAIHKQKHYHLNHKDLFYDISDILIDLNPAPRISFDQLLQGR